MCVYISSAALVIERLLSSTIPMIARLHFRSTKVADSPDVSECKCTKLVRHVRTRWRTCTNDTRSPAAESWKPPSRCKQRRRGRWRTGQATLISGSGMAREAKGAKGIITRRRRGKRKKGNGKGERKGDRLSRNRYSSPCSNWIARAALRAPSPPPSSLSLIRIYYSNQMF